MGSTIHHSRIAAEFRGTEKNPCLLASVQLPSARDDLSSSESAVEGGSEARAYQEPPVRTLGIEPWLAIAYIHLNRLIKKLDLGVIFMAGPGHGALGSWALHISRGRTPRFIPNRAITNSVCASS